MSTLSEQRPPISSSGAAHANVPATSSSLLTYPCASKGIIQGNPQGSRGAEGLHTTQAWKWALALRGRRCTGHFDVRSALDGQICSHKKPVKMMLEACKRQSGRQTCVL
jgi:hypothetical protein